MDHKHNMLFKLLKFFLNVIEPETAHKFAIKFIKSPLLKSKNFENNSYENLNQRIFGLNFKTLISTHNLKNLHQCTTKLSCAGYAIKSPVASNTLKLIFNSNCSSAPQDYILCIRF